MTCASPTYKEFFAELLMLCSVQIYAAPILFERNAYEVPVFTRVHDFMWSGVTRSSPHPAC